MAHPTNRRTFLNTLGAVGAAAVLPRVLRGVETQTPKPAQTAIPRWRGFNLLNFFQAFSRAEEGDRTVPEDDCKWIRDWGFDFVRVPMDYWLWIDSDWRQTRKLRADDMLKIKESTLDEIDRAVDLGRKYSLHVSLNFHRAPGYCINDPQREALVLWSDKLAEDAFVHHWDVFAKRYQGVPAKDLSFNLVNEAPSPRKGYMTREDYRRVMTRATNKIRETSPDRLVIIDGLSVGNDVVDEMIPTKVVQSVHAYRPAEISHFRASWVDRKSSFPEPTWPLKNKDGSIKLDRAGLEKMYAPWADLARKGIGVHCGEGGAFNRTPYRVFMGWMEDVMDVLKGYGIGYALWNFRGSFGILDSGRKDIEYEDWHGHKLDRKLLALLQKY
jgi:endoglucanase